MKATELLKKDHAAVKRLFAEFGRTTRRAKKSRAGLIERIAAELEIHAQIEEEIFYPAVGEIDEARRLVGGAREDHEHVKELIAEIRAMDAGQVDLPARVRELRDAVTDHATEEEHEMFPLAERLGDDQVALLGAQLEARKQELMPADVTRTGTKRGRRAA